MTIDARRHELRQADRAGIAALHRQRVQALLVAQHEELFELIAKERAAIAPAGGEVEGQRRERVDDAERPHVLAVQRLDADDADDDFRRHAVAVFGEAQPGFVGGPERDAGIDALRLDEARTVRCPVLRRAGGRRQDVLDHVGSQARLGERRLHPRRIEPVTQCEVGAEAHHIFALAVGDVVERLLDAHLTNGGLLLRDGARVCDGERRRDGDNSDSADCLMKRHGSDYRVRTSCRAVAAKRRVSCESGRDAAARL